MTVWIAQVRRATPFVLARRDFDCDAAMFELSHNAVKITHGKANMILAGKPSGSRFVSCVNQYARIAHFEDCQTIFTMCWLGVQQPLIETSHRIDIVSEDCPLMELHVTIRRS